MPADDPLYIASLITAVQDAIDDNDELAEALQTPEGRMAVFRALLAVAGQVLCGPDEDESLLWETVLTATGEAREHILEAYHRAKSELN